MKGRTQSPALKRRFEDTSGLPLVSASKGINPHGFDDQAESGTPLTSTFALLVRVLEQRLYDSDTMHSGLGKPIS